MRPAFRRVLEVQRPDLIVSHFALYTIPVLQPLRQFPLVVHFHGPWAEESAVQENATARNAAKRWIENLVYRRAERAIVLSNAFAELLANAYRFPRERIDIIPGGVDLQRFQTALSCEAARERLNWPIDRPIIVAVRRLVPRMGLENLLTAMRDIRRHIPDIQLMIAGRGMLAPQLQAQIAAQNLEQNVRLLGFVRDEDLPLVYAAADLSVVPTVALEGFGLIAAESLAAGTPCLVSPIGGLPEVVAPLSERLVLPSAAPADIAEAVVSALRGDLILPDRTSCQAYAAAMFDWRVIASRVAGIYRRAVA
jgi:glycosyltransferase involved in cell wall biosynthesis